MTNNATKRFVKPVPSHVNFVHGVHFPKNCKLKSGHSDILVIAALIQWDVRTIAIDFFYFSHDHCLVV